jgi:hypothetical protein
MKLLQSRAVLGVFLLLATLPQSCIAASLFDTLSPAAKEVSKDIGVSSYIAEILDMREKFATPSAKRHDPQFLYVKQEMTEILLTTFLETRDLVADIDDEMSRSEELRNLLASRRDKAIRLNNITNFVSGGALAMVASGIQVGGGNAISNAGNVMEVGAGALATGISSYALKQSSGEKRSSGASPNLLAKLFDLPVTKDKDIPDKEIPSSIWKYLNDPVPGGKDGLTRRDFLIQRWVQLGRIPPPKSKAGQRRVALIAGAVPQVHQVTIELLEDRAAMLNDMRAAVGEMSRELLEIMKLMRKM